MTTVFAHRGSKGNRPENTLAAFREAVRVGADGIELDVHRTKDGALVVIHDETLDRTTNGHGLVRRQTLESIRQLDAGSWFHPLYFRERVPTLEEVLDVLEAAGFTGILNVEIKTDKYPYFGIEQAIAEVMLAKQRSFSHMYCSFNLFSLFQMSRYDQGAELAYLLKKNPFKVWLANLFPFIGSIHPHRSYKLKGIPKKAIRFWTLNKETDMSRAYQSQVAGFMTDFPEKAMALKKEQDLIDRSRGKDVLANE